MIQDGSDTLDSDDTGWVGYYSKDTGWGGC